MRLRLSTVRPLFLVVAFSALALGCDSSGPEAAALAAPGPEGYSLAAEVEALDAPLRSEGRATYVLTDLPRGAGYHTATLTMEPARAGDARVRIALYVNQGGDDIFPDPGDYEIASRTVVPPLVTAEIDGRTFSPYLGTITIESASETELVGSLDVQITTGGCAYFPTCSGPTRTGTLRARFRATASGETGEENDLPSQRS